MPRCFAPIEAREVPETFVVRLYRLCAALMIAAVIFPSQRTAADTAPPVLVIVDGSGSMWGKMDGSQTAKLYAVRDLLRDRLLKAAPQSRIGLASFGHRRKGDCGDVEIITPIEAGGTQGAVAALEQLNPRGKGPLTAAVREGAKAIGSGTPGHIVLIHDNADNCSQDICAAANDIAKSNPSLKVHVLSLGLSKSDRDRMQCLAKTTKGLQFDAGDDSQMADALTAIVKAAGLDAVAEPSAPIAAATPAVPALGPPGLRLSASLSDGGAPVDGAVSWRIVKAGSPADNPPLVDRQSREINENVDPGRYEVTLTYGLIRRTLEIDVGTEGPSVRRIDLDGGRLSVTSAASKQGDALRAPVMTITSLRGSENEPASVLWLGREAKTDQAVPAGRYLVEVADGLARNRSIVEVKPGSTARADLILDTGLLELTATAVSGGPPLDRVLYTVSADDPSAPDGRREVARSTAPVAAFTLQAGTYYVTARHGAGEHREQVAVSSGDTVRRTLVLDVGRLSVVPALPETAQTDRAVITRVYEAAGDKRLVGQSTAAKPQFTLGAGRYRVTCEIGRSNVRAERVIDLGAGSDVSSDIKLDASLMSLSGLDVSSRASVRDSAGQVVWRSHAGTAGSKILIAPGQYTVAFDRAGAEVEKAVRIEPNSAVTVDLAVP
jgi:Ca-activated chloride channel family protein